MLGLAVQEEYKARYLYASVLEDFPGAIPFAAIVESEMRHVEALQTLFTRRQMTPPTSVWTPGSFPPYATLALACAGGVTAETEDAAFYTPYLQRTDLPRMSATSSPTCRPRRSRITCLPSRAVSSEDS